MEGPTRERYNVLEHSIRAIPSALGREPKAILMISGHWEESEFTISSGDLPTMIYDYYGFPDYTYQIRYPAPGSPDIAAAAAHLLRGAGLDCRLDPERGFDHGTFSLMKPLRPQADWPVVQLSLQHNMDPRQHIEAGRALAPLRDEGVLIIGSGLSYHNLRMLGPEASAPSALFDDWLQECLLGANGEVRSMRLERWLQDAPCARLAHPREDHLLPLMVAVGAAITDQGSCVYHEDRFFGTMTVSSFRFG